MNNKIADIDVDLSKFFGLAMSSQSMDKIGETDRVGELARAEILACADKLIHRLKWTHDSFVLPNLGEALKHALSEDEKLNIARVIYRLIQTVEKVRNRRS